MYSLLTILHIAVCFFLILVVLLQTGKGQDLASAFGGGASQTVFGSAGAASALTKATSAGAILFMLTSLGLAIISTQSRSVMDTAPIPDTKVEDVLPAEAPGPVDDASQGTGEVPSGDETTAPSTEPELEKSEAQGTVEAPTGESQNTEQNVVLEPESDADASGSQDGLEDFGPPLPGAGNDESQPASEGSP